MQEYGPEFCKTPGAALLFTCGPEASERIGHVEGSPVFHASLSPEGGAACLAEAGFETLAYEPDDPDCDYHTVRLARFTA